MRSSTGKHYPALDHVRALAILLVFAWHFTHALTGTPVPFEGAPAVPPFALFDEGHCGVSLFMVLSGYLFAKLIDGKQVNYRAFFWNRFIRLAPLLVVVMIIVGILATRTVPVVDYLKDLAKGFVVPGWPNGGWSIAVEMHFYLLLPALIFLRKRWPLAPLVVVATAVLVRALLFVEAGEVQYLAYWTIFGRIDQFVLGMAAFTFGGLIRGRHAVAGSIAVGFVAFYWWFDDIGGWMFTKQSPIWIIVPTIEAFAFASLVAYYDSTFRPPNTGISWAIAKVGEYSYSLYLLHTFVVFRLAAWIDTHVIDLSNFYVAFAAAMVSFALVLPIAAASYQFLEAPALKLRKRYIVSREPESVRSARSPWPARLN